MISALHGFLGLPTDWDLLRTADFDVTTPSLDAIPDEGDTLLGYSLGGRLALHALLDGARYRRAVIISAGLGTERDREERRARDEVWAQRFERDPWPELMHDWNAQAIFGGHVLERREEDFDRATLARMLRDWSPATLPPIASRLHELSLPVLWIAGERDAAYVTVANRAVELLPNAQLVVIEGAAHRVPWEQPRSLIERLRAFLDFS